MHQDQPIYEFIPLSGEGASSLECKAGICLVIIGILISITFLLIAEFGVCNTNGRLVSCREHILGFILTGTVIFALGISLVIIAGQKGKQDTREVYGCYTDYIQAYGVTVRRENMKSISFGYNIGQKRKGIGYIEIKTNIPVHIPEDEGDDLPLILLEDIPNVQDSYFKIKYLYKLPESED